MTGMDDPSADDRRDQREGVRTPDGDGVHPPAQGGRDANLDKGIRADEVEEGLYPQRFPCEPCRVPPLSGDLDGKFPEVRRSDNRLKSTWLFFLAPVAQLDRVSPSEGEGHRFESCRVRHQTFNYLF